MYYVNYQIARGASIARYGIPLLTTNDEERNDGVRKSEELMEKLRLAPPKKGFTNFYSPQFDPSTMTEFSAAAYRSLHGLVPNHYDLSDEERCPFRKILLKDIYVDPGVIEKKHNFDALCRGFTSQPCESPDSRFAAGVTNFLLKLPNVAHGEDLEATDIQRGRDHGLPTYNDMRHYCGLPRARHFRDLLDVIPEKRKKEQNEMARYKRRKVLHFEVNSKSQEQINGIKKTSLAALICENLSIKHIQPHAFLQISKR
ncbi:hypothetical protein J437_LFUL004976 [Ladona fulva]|uniref:Uncharacterized protein n=1 Tax=Ladona fulva TaxID=123851 RepID=A0A8K0JW64_LADFU|nr:hypothetical protein J437_LFUL004976 [Ladona fulva]